jgi:hypothetical protein
MKVRLMLLLTLATFLVLPSFIMESCSTAKQLAAFDVVYAFPKVYFSYSPSSKKTSEITLYTAKLTVDMDSILSANHVPSGFISSAYLSKVSMNITAPPEATFNWLQAIRLIGCIDSTFHQPTDLGSAINIDPNAKTVDLTLNKVDIKPLFFKNSYYVRILATPSGQVPASSISMYLASEIKLHIEPL